MRTLPMGGRAPLAALVLAVVMACGEDGVADAYGNFEATEVVVSAQTSGQIERFTPTEGMYLQRDAVAALIDTTQLALEVRQLLAQRAAMASRGAEVDEQLDALAVQHEIARRAYERTQRLHAAQAATVQQLDQAEREFRVLGAQIEALRAQRRSVGMETASTDARVAQIRDRLARSSVANPQAGTVLATYARAGEVVQSGQPLYRIAELDTLTLRAWVSGAQLGSVRLGQLVRVRIDAGGAAEQRALVGTVTWISPEAEFTPTPVQTRDERADLVYAVKVRVANPDGILKIGMPADISLAAIAPATDRPTPVRP